MKQQQKERTVFTISCSINEGATLSIILPIKLFDEFEELGESDKGMTLLCTIFDEYSRLSDENRYYFQDFILKNSHTIIDMRDILCIARVAKNWQKQ